MNKKGLYYPVSLILVVMVAFFANWGVAFGDDVTVSATINTSVSCNTATTTTAFGTLTTGAVSTSTPNVTSTLSCNYALGCTLQVDDAGNGANPGLATTSPAYLIQSQSATLSNGVEGYGIQVATTTAGTGGTLGLSATYRVTGNQVGALSLTPVTLASSTAPISGREVVVTHKAAISGLTPAGSYTDTITYGCTGN